MKKRSYPVKKLTSFEKWLVIETELVHFYHEITPEELRTICLHHVDDIKQILDLLLQWTERHHHPKK